MCHNIMEDPTFLFVLYRLDLGMAEDVKASDCPLCGSPLDWANFTRKERGLPPDLPPEYRRGIRFALCCRHEACRKRCLPPSVRFLGRRVYFGFVITLASAMDQGLTKAREAALARLNISRQTLHRWKTWWQTTFPKTPTWQRIKIHFTNASRLPDDPLMALHADTVQQKIILWLKLLAPLSTESSHYLPKVDFTQRM